MANNYINNKEFWQAIHDYQVDRSEAMNAGQKPPRIPDYIGECFIKISTNTARLPKFVMYTFKDEMISDGIENCIRYFNNFNPFVYKNPFAYFTTIIYNTFIRMIKKEKKKLYRKYKAIQELGILDEQEQLEDDNGYMRQFTVYKNIEEFIETYEESERKAREKRKDKKKTKGEKSVDLGDFFE